MERCQHLAILCLALAIGACALSSLAQENPAPAPTAESAAAQAPESPPVESPPVESASMESPNVSAMLSIPSSAGATHASAGDERFSRWTVLVASLTVFALAVFVGFEVIAKVPPTLHTPLMSGSNAISGITVVGSIIAAGNAGGGFASLVAMIAVGLAMVNVVGGFFVTYRMLLMFKKR